jgi:hypothetical protein
MLICLINRKEIESIGRKMKRKLITARKFKPYFLIIFTLFFLMLSCSSGSQVTKPDLNYAVIDITKGSGTKCVLNIRLQNRIYEDEIKQIAEYLKENEGKDCSPLFIFYFLPDVEPEIYTAWAWSDFTPDLDVSIIGLSLEREATLMSITPIVDGIIVGKWIQTMAGHDLIVISIVNDSYLMTDIAPNESKYTKTLDVEVVDGEERLYVFPRTGYNDYMVIRENGNLAYYDDLGLLMELPPR